jgi:hypothetical protein
MLGSSSIDDDDDDDDDDDNDDEGEEEDTTAATTLPAVSPLSFAVSLLPAVSCTSSSIPVTSPSSPPSLLLKLLVLSEYHLAIEGFLPAVCTSHHITSHLMTSHLMTPHQAYDTSNDGSTNRIEYYKVYCNSPGMMIR